MLQNVLKGKFLVRNAYIKKIEISQIHNLTLYLKKLEEKKNKLSPMLTEVSKD